MNTQDLKIIIVEKDETLHAAYLNQLRAVDGFILMGIYNCPSKALKDFNRTRPDIVLTEIDLSGTSGLDTIQLYKKKDWNVKVVMISENNDFELIKKSFKKGANGYLTKPMSADKFSHALTSVKEEGATLSNDIVKQVVSNYNKKSFSFFSERENQIVDYLCNGATYKMIADKLFVTTSTVNFHIQNIYLKLDVNSKSEALSKLQSL
ncbi:response regulator transcription factor [Maribacter cobaltidurans]|uniref:DNA-binding response regulator n=1 Tax=Maribacter cobaltidurans TaxID=1178778 RepID=A0A223V8F3_9FLAO|nr:response regulator transcription factor [Maribacter cobaltidurans]ASV31685.1 DNA-binding response regulator [Maribacter cobaltidurans]GGD93805.1 DNA-binding response regulator [Maribacter cobaltidurans]